jgi:Na+-transporting NADH:ubiquinone oxidoreductase subunit NqrC
MSIILWVIVVHLIELILISGYLLIKKNRTLEKMVVEQQQYMDSISIVIENSDTTLKQMDIQGAFEADDEVGIFFKNLKAIQEVINQFNIRKS